MDSDVINVLVAVVVIFGLVRWWSKPAGAEGEGGANQRPQLGFRPRNVTPAMITSVQNAFPQEPRANVHYDLLRTGNVQVTCNTLIEKGFLPPPPPAFFQLYPQPDQPAPASSSNSTHDSSKSTSKGGQPATLIERFGLEKDVSASANAGADAKAAWLDTAQKREASLKERKAAMILAARQKLLEKQAKGKGKETPVAST